MDRTFVDGSGIRWIIDYKTSTHEGGRLNAFLDREQERYLGQLERYAAGGVLSRVNPSQAANWRPFRLLGELTVRHDRSIARS